MQNPIEIYQQRYETFRHLDRLRWQMLQIAVATAAGVLVVRGTDIGPTATALAAIVLIALGAAMLRIGHGIRKNALELAEAGKAIGDSKIPVTNGTISTAIALLIVLAGGMLGLAFFGQQLNVERHSDAAQSIRQLPSQE